MKVLRVGVLGSGDVARRISGTIQKMSEVELYCVASRHCENAIKLARDYGYKNVRESYDDVINDPNVDMVYIALLHPQHYAYALKCLEANKPVLCEKPFTMNLKQAKTLIEGFERKGLFISEALWTRFLPARKRIETYLKSGALGDIALIDVNMICNIAHLDRMVNPEKGGGALLDLGVYALNFVDMFIGTENCDIKTMCAEHKSGVDDTDVVIIKTPNGKLAACKISMSGCGNPKGAIYGTKGRIEVSDVMNFERVGIYDEKNVLVDEFRLDAGKMGYEYEFLACRDALLNNQTELESMPHSATINLMRQYDRLRETWGITYPEE